MRTVTVTTRKRGFFGHAFKWLFFIFNAAMAWWMIAYWMQLAEGPAAVTEAQKAGRALGGAAGTGFIMTMWLMGGAILGGLALATRGKEVSVTTMREEA